MFLQHGGHMGSGSGHGFLQDTPVLLSSPDPSLVPQQASPADHEQG